MRKRATQDVDLLLDIIKRQESEIKLLNDTVKSKEEHINKLYDRLVGTTQTYVNVAEIIKASSQQSIPQQLDSPRESSQ